MYENEEQLPAIPYLAHPLEGRRHNISEGWFYTPSERKIHHQTNHRAIDFAVPHGTPVYAAAEGLAVAFYHRFVPTYSDGRPMLYNGMPFGNGYGNAVQIYHPEEVSGVHGGRYTQYGHLSRFAPGIRPRITKPKDSNLIENILEINHKRQNDVNRLSQDQILEVISLLSNYPWLASVYGYSFEQSPWEREAYALLPHELFALEKAAYPYITRVKQGDLIGYSGTSALILGEAHYEENIESPNEPAVNTWDEPHLHFVEVSRDPATWMRVGERDPYDVYYMASQFYDDEEYWGERMLWMDV